MQSLTANQLILLLQIYRGTLDKEFKIGTYETDLEHLRAKGFIEVNRDRLFLTWGGNQLVKNHLLVLPA